MRRRELLTGSATAALSAGAAHAFGIGRLGAGVGRLGLLGGAGKAVVLWTPLNLGSDLVAWWDPQDTANIVLSGSNVSSWTDKFSGIAATQATSGNQPVWSATARNGKAGLTFAGAQTLNFTATGFPTGTDPHTVLLAGESTTSGTAAAFFWGTEAPNECREVASVSGLAYMAYFGPDHTTTTNWLNADLCFIDTTTGGASPTDNFYPDGGAVQSATPGAFNTVGTVGVFGAKPSGVTPWFGVIQQIVVCNAVLSTSDRQNLEGWESWYDGKAGSNLPIGHPYKLHPPTVASWNDPSLWVDGNIWKEAA
jgi:hypothetical protein